MFISIPAFPDESKKDIDDTGASLPSYVTLALPVKISWLIESMFSVVDGLFLVNTL